MNQVTLGGKTVHTPPHLVGMTDLEGSLSPILQSAIRLKKQASEGPLPKHLAGKAIIMLFEKNSTRTRVSFEVGIQRLGGICVSLDGDNTQIARGESLEDTAQVLSRYGDAIVYRANAHANVAGLAKHATIPVVNALTELEHPCQILADWQTLLEKWGNLRGRTFAYIGDGNNMCHSYMLGAAMVGMNIRVACPEAFAPNADIVEQAEVLAKMNGSTVHVCTDPLDAVDGAEAVATDTWISMGDEDQEAARRAAFHGYTIDEAMMQCAAPGALFMHCLPGHWGEEATHAVAHGPRSVIYDQAENRMWAQMALLVHIVGNA